MNKPLVDSRGQRIPDIEAPGPDRLRLYGDMMFLAFRSPRHAGMTLGGLRGYLEPPIETGQFRVFRFDDVPRALYTWAWLDAEAEHKLITGAPLERGDWQSGDHLWVIDLIAPYRGLTSRIGRWMMERGNFAERDFYFRRVGGENETRRIVHVDFDADRLSRVWTGEAYLDRLGG